MQYQVDESNNAKYGAYSLSGSVGLFGKLQLENGWLLGADSNFIPTKIFTDTTASVTTTRSGWTENTRIYLSKQKPSTFFNPGIFLTGEYAQPNGTEYQSRKLGLDFANTMYLSSKIIFGHSAGFSDVYYPNRSSEIRNDQIFLISMNGGYNATDYLMILVDASYLNNLSNVQTFRFDRWSGSLTGLYRF